MQIVDTPDGIRAFRLLALRGALSLECMGLKRRGRPASVIVRETMGSTTRPKFKLLAEYEQWLRDQGVLK